MTSTVRKVPLARTRRGSADVSANSSRASSQRMSRARIPAPRPDGRLPSTDRLHRVARDLEHFGLAAVEGREPDVDPPDLVVARRVDPVSLDGVADDHALRAEGRERLAQHLAV